MKKRTIAMLIILSTISVYSHAEGGGDIVLERMESLRNAAMEAKKKAQAEGKTTKINDKEKEKKETSQKDR